MSQKNLLFSSRKTKLIFIFFALSLKFTNANRYQLSRSIRPNTDEETQQRAALNVIRRVIADKADNVAIKINFNLPGNYFKVRTYPSTRKPMNKFSFLMNFFSLIPPILRRSAKQIIPKCFVLKRRTVRLHAKRFITT